MRLYSIGGKVMDGYQMKRILEDIIDVAYPKVTGREKRRYKGFYIKPMQKKYKSKLGDYDPRTRTIRLFDIENRSIVSTVVTSLHELAHHIDWCDRGDECWMRGWHQKPFYDVYRILLYAGLEFGYFRKEDFLSSIRDQRDYNKVCRMLNEYEGEEGEFKSGIRRVSVKDAYAIKEHLKVRGYMFDSVTKEWYVEVPEAELKSYTAYLDANEARYEVTDPSEMSFTMSCKALPESWCGHTFTQEEREALKNGKPVHADDFWSSKRHKHFSCSLFWESNRFRPEFRSET